LRKADLQVKNARHIRYGFLRQMIGAPTHEELEIHHQIAENRRDVDLQAAERWLVKLLALNDAGNRFERTVLQREISRKWWLTCRKNMNHNRETLAAYLRSPLSAHYRPQRIKYWKFVLRCIAARND